jgi:Holliday junction resolvase RusA-like endonuclease
MHTDDDGTVKLWVSDNSGDAGKAWRTTIGYAANAAMRGRARYEGPLYVEFTVVRKRNSGHFGQGRNAGKLLPSAPRYPATKPDAVKLARALEDALTGIVWGDDSRNCVVRAEKVYAEPGEPPGAHVKLWTLAATVGAARPPADQLALSA